MLARCLHVSVAVAVCAILEGKDEGLGERPIEGRTFL